MLRVSSYIKEFGEVFRNSKDELPWAFVSSLQVTLSERIKSLSSDFKINGNVAIHKTAVIEEHVTLKGPLIISENCFVAAHVYLRNGVYLGHHVSLGPGCEVKSSCIFSNSALAHFNFVGDSLLGSGINMEAGAVIANHYNERASKEIEVMINGVRVKTGSEKFGAMVGDGTRIGANAVLSPGTLLMPNSIIRRLELVTQI